MNIAKMHGCGNTFVVVDTAGHEQHDAQNRHFAEAFVRTDGFRPDGFLFVTREKTRMIYYDIDRATGMASRAGMCGNGIRCFARYVHDSYGIGPFMQIMTDDGVKDATVTGNTVSVNMGPAREFGTIDENTYHVNTSIAHIVRFDDALKYDDSYLQKARAEGRTIRFDKALMARFGHPEGFQVNFVRVDNKQKIAIATYEAGVEDITQACGTGATASAYVAASVRGAAYPVEVKNIGGELVIDSRKGDLYLTGPAEYIW